MKPVYATRNTKSISIFLLASLIFCGLLGLASISLAAGNTWTQKANMPTVRAFFSTSAVNGKIYAIGGFGPSGAFVVLSTVEEYDPVTDTWTKKADIPTARGSLSTSAVNGKIYAIGGDTAHHGPNVLVVSTVEEYNPTTDTWAKKANMPTSRVYLSTSAVNGKIYAIGGFAQSILFGGVPGLSTVEEYDPATDTWTKKADMPTARGTLSTSAVNGKNYAIGGETEHDGSQVPTVEEYDPGFVPQSTEVSPQGKLATTWGNIKNFVR